MSGFKALNLESDDESDVDFDDTKELQIEETLKLYQTAVKLHADGPDSFEEAAKAYEELFRSEIFQYPESQTELRRIELYGPLPEIEDEWESGVAAANAAVATGLDSGPSTLPVILHLSHKNYAQFKLEYLDARMQYLNFSLNQILKDASDALDHFVHALDKDETDLDLWSRTAAVGRILDSKRVARFCLEAVLDGDDEGLGSLLSSPGLAEGLAADHLRKIVGELDDQLSSLQARLPVGKKTMLSRMLKQQMDGYESINVRQNGLRKLQPRLEAPPSAPIVLKAPKTWTELGSSLLERHAEQQKGAGPFAAAMRITFVAPPSPAQLTYEMALAHDEVQQDPNAVLSISPLNPESAAAQFPGLGNGQPTKQPQMDPSADNRPSPAEPAVMEQRETINLPTRKRSVDAAGLAEGTEEGRAKSKRTRTRESGFAEDNRQTVEDANRRWEQDQKLGEMQAADDWMFGTVGSLFERVGVWSLADGKNVREDVQDSEKDGPKGGLWSSPSGLSLAKPDLQAFLSNFSPELAQLLTASGDPLDTAQYNESAGVNGSASSSTIGKAVVEKMPPVPNDGLLELLEDMAQSPPLLDDAACLWLERLLQPPPDAPAYLLRENSYSRHQWSEELKTMVVQNLITFDETLLARTIASLAELRALGASKESTSRRATPARASMLRIATLAETIFELHLDVYCLVKRPNSGVSEQTVTSQQDRLARWADVAREAMQLRAVCDPVDPDVILDEILEDDLSLRFLWATTFQIGASDDAPQEHVIELLHDLRAAVDMRSKSIHLQNNAIMPELSTAALDREISRLKTKDFFVKVASQDVSDPITVIESLEPLLAALDEDSQGGIVYRERRSPSPSPDALSGLVSFLRDSDSSIRLMLWLRLRDAYVKIDYKPMVVSCYFQILRMLMNELISDCTDENSQADRQALILKTLRQARDIIKKVLGLVTSSEIAFECVDEDALAMTVELLGQVLQLTQVFNIFEDAIRVGQIEGPKAPSGTEDAAFCAVSKACHEMQVHIWIVLYRLFEEAIFQNPGLYPTPAEDRFEFLRTVHRNFGLRHICGESNRAFVQLLKVEFFQMTHVEGYDSEQAQVLYDLYGINCFLNPSYELMDHQCTHDASIDRGVAMQSVDLLIQQASKLPMKDLIKHPLKDTIDKIHGHLPRKKPTEVIIRNREIYRTYLRSPINPLDLYACLKGEGSQLDVTPVPKSDAVLASKGWYFLMGHIALAKFRSVKRTTPAPTEDVDIAIAFFNQDLEYSGNHWDTWFRLGQAYDTKIEESVVWSAEKLNNSMQEVVQLLRATIHCYAMATALAYRSADLRAETSDKMTELFTDFAMRIYASSREPFGMRPFELDDTDKFLSYTQGVARGKPYQPLRPYTAWKFAKVLFQRALAGKPESWHLHYMQGKCLWKMHVATNLGPKDVRPEAQQVLASFIQAIEFIPDANKKDSREKREPILEPHYKLVSIVHKLMSKGHITLAEATQALEHTPYARSVTSPQDSDGWTSYVLAVLRNLRVADKSNWHHRMVDRVAQIIYDDARTRGGSDDTGALGAKHELTQQMFTKTMVQQVWRPESERAGRHFVYTARYTRFFVRILEQLKDRASLEMLARRVRRRPNDLFEHALVWQDICNAYLRLLRAHASLAEGLETSTFSNIAHEDFLARKEPLEKWMQAQESGSSAALDVLREVQELKKINQSLMKPGPIDDLIGDSYAYLFNNVGKQLWEEERRIKLEEEARRPPPVASPSRNPMMSLTHLMNVDGTADQPAPPAAAAQATAEPAARRKIGVGRREIRTAAEACVQKPKPALTGHEITFKGPLPRVQVVIDNSRVERPGDMSVDTSAPGSVHDDADDESELSDLEEDADDEDEGDGGVSVKGPEASRPLFPGLISEGPSRQTSEEGGNENDDESGSEAVKYEDRGDEDVQMGEGDIVAVEDAANGAES